MSRSGKPALGRLSDGSSRHGRVCAMEIAEFWAIIDAARLTAASLPGDPRSAVATVLTDRLAAASKQTVLEYQECFDELHGAVHRWDVWAAACLIGGGCSDDPFMDFRAGLIIQGRDWFERAAAAPDSLADHPDVIAGAREPHDPGAVLRDGQLRVVSPHVV